nr:hypothetical protein GCM10020093_011960 [Planobispora longispora]
MHDPADGEEPHGPPGARSDPIDGEEPQDPPGREERAVIRWTAGLKAGLAGLAAVALVGLAAPYLFGEAAQQLSGAAREGVSAGHWLGTDALGRDVLARTLVATRLTLLMTAAATAIAGVLGILIGTTVWVAGPRVRETGLRLIDVMVSYPAVILALVVAAILGPDRSPRCWRSASRGARPSPGSPPAWPPRSPGATSSPPPGCWACRRTAS